MFNDEIERIGSRSRINPISHSSIGSPILHPINFCSVQPCIQFRRFYSMVHPVSLLFVTQIHTSKYINSSSSASAATPPTTYLIPTNKFLIWGQIFKVIGWSLVAGNLFVRELIWTLSVFHDRFNKFSLIINRVQMKLAEVLWVIWLLRTTLIPAVHINVSISQHFSNTTYLACKRHSIH